MKWYVYKPEKELSWLENSTRAVRFPISVGRDPDRQ